MKQMIALWSMVMVHGLMVAGLSLVGSEMCIRDRQLPEGPQ